MGYRSDVAFMLYKEDWEGLKSLGDEFYQNNIKNGFVNYKSFFSYPAEEEKEFTVDGNTYVYKKYGGLKFYPEFEDVELFLEFIKGIPHSLVIIGEDDCDIETQYHVGQDCVFYRLRPKREIVLEED